jgi:hypothetical protein
MSHYIPVFFFPIEPKKVPPELNGWESAIDILSERLKQQEVYGMRISTSRNGWHQHALRLICAGLDIGRLEFVDEEVAYLDRTGLEAAAHALDHVMRETKNGVPFLGQEVDELGSIWHLRYELTSQGNRLYRPDLIRQAFDESRPVYNVDGLESDIGYTSIVRFFAFLKSLRQAIEEALTSGKGLLYVQPQP